MKPKKTHFVSEECATTVPEEQVDEESYKMCALRDKSSEPVIVKCLLNGVPTDMEYDTGGSLSIISQDTYTKFSKSSRIGDLDLETNLLKGQKCVSIYMDDILVTSKSTESICII